MFDFGREVTGNLLVAGSREWLVTNGIGGYASGTIAGHLTRRYHGLLMAALQPPLGRTLLLAKLEETVEYDSIYPDNGRFYELYCNRWSNGAIEPDGYKYIERFHLEGTIPVWTFAIANALLQKRIWMQPGANTTYIQYKLTRATSPMTIDIRSLVNYRDYHATTIMDNRDVDIQAVENGLSYVLDDGAQPFYLLTDQAEITPQFDWHEDYLLSVEDYRGQSDIQDDHMKGGRFKKTLRQGESFIVVASTEPKPTLDGDIALQQRKDYESELLARANVTHAEPAMKQLVLAADQFIVKRPTAQDKNGRSIIAGYHWFSDWGRDTMIALPGLTLNTNRSEIAASILRTYAQFVDQGMIPNRFPDVGQKPEYNTVDATLWYFEAIRAYYATTSDKNLLIELYPVLEDIIKWHMRGTRYNIQMDKTDGLIYAGEAGVQLTWMDAKIGNWVVTDRIGKPVEINALWYNALRSMAAFARELGKDGTSFDVLADNTKTGFARYWNAPRGYLYDILDGPDGHDSKLRPNQLLAISLHHSPLPANQRQSVVDVCSRHLLTGSGLRSLSPDDEDYVGHYGGNQLKRDSAYHQGTVWGWLLGPFIEAHLKVYHDAEMAKSYLRPLVRELLDAGVGTLSEIFDGNPPFTPRGCIAQAWSVAEVLRVWQLIENW